MEYADIVAAAEVAARVSNAQSLRALFSRKYSPMTITTSLIALFQQLTGINGEAGGHPAGWRAGCWMPGWPLPCAAPPPPAAQLGSALFNPCFHGAQPSCSTCPSSSPPWAPAAPRPCSTLSSSAPVS